MILISDLIVQLMIIVNLKYPCLFWKLQEEKKNPFALVKKRGEKKIPSGWEVKTALVRIRFYSFFEPFGKEKNLIQLGFDRIRS